jgi:hypothetical protein
MGIDFDQNMKQVKKERVKLAEIQQIMTPLIKASVDINENVDEINDNVDNPLNEEVDDNANA